ncbi:hypothetical protein SUGI_0438640 [Cryptomeria japonica]|nr:hypothetical protein SUGI_0438640 [Cryptomeria japonica]
MAGRNGGVLFNLQNPPIFSHPASRGRSYEGSRSTGSRGGDAIEQAAIDPEGISQSGSNTFFRGFRDRCHSPSWVDSIFQGPSLQIHLRLEILSSQCNSSASHGQDNATVNVQISRSSETLATQYTEGKVVPFELPDDLIEVISEWKVKTIVLFFLKGVPGFF